MEVIKTIQALPNTQPGTSPDALPLTRRQGNEKVTAIFSCPLYCTATPPACQVQPCLVKLILPTRRCNEPRSRRSCIAPRPQSKCACPDLVQQARRWSNTFAGDELPTLPAPMTPRSPCCLEQQQGDRGISPGRTGVHFSFLDNINSADLQEQLRYGRVGG